MKLLLKFHSHTKTCEVRQASQTYEVQIVVAEGLRIPSLAFRRGLHLDSTAKLLVARQFSVTLLLFDQTTQASGLIFMGQLPPL